MTNLERAALGYAPELAVVDVLRAAAAATRAALVSAHPFISHPEQPLEAYLADKLQLAISQLELAIDAYCKRALVPPLDDDVTF